MTDVTYRTVDEHHHQQRLDNFLLTGLKMPRAFIYRIIRSGEVRVNQKRADPKYRLAVGDRVRIPPYVPASESKTIATASSKFKHQALMLEQAILFENQDFLVLNKPPTLAVHQGSTENVGVIELLKAHREGSFLELVHRLDKATSGCLIIAKKASILKALHAALRDREVKKTYHALVRGHWPKSLNKISLPIEDKPALTTFQVLHYYDQATLISAHPTTGRKHQIRLHAAQAKHPIIGDDKYGNFALNRDFAKRYAIKRLCLHAHEIAFTLNNQRFKFTAPIDFSLKPICAMIDSHE